MTFTIQGEDFTFNLTVDGSGILRGINATRGGVTYSCKIQVKSEANPADVMCCGPDGCTAGGCFDQASAQQSAPPTLS